MILISNIKIVEVMEIPRSGVKDKRGREEEGSRLEREANE